MIHLRTSALPRLNFRRRIAALVWARRLVKPLMVLAVLGSFSGAWDHVGLRPVGVVFGWIGIFGGFMLALALLVAFKAWETSLRRQFVREAGLPPFLAAKIRAAHPQLTERDAELVLRGLRQFFMAHLRSGRKFVGMPSKVVDTAWHEFILHTQGYQRQAQRRAAPHLVLGLQGGKHRPARSLAPAAAVCAGRQIRHRRGFQLRAGLQRRRPQRGLDCALRYQFWRFGQRFVVFIILV